MLVGQLSFTRQLREIRYLTSCEISFMVDCITVVMFKQIAFNMCPVLCALLLVFNCLLCNYCWLTVCIVVVVTCVLLSYVHLLYCVYIAVFLF